MSGKSPRVDEYIGKAAPYAKPILLRLRAIFHEAAPQIEEDIKWGIPAFMHKGIVCNLAAFKQHVSFGFWKGKLMKDPDGLFINKERTQITAIKLTTVDDIPPVDTLKAYIREAVDLNERGVKLPSAKKNAGREKLEVPEDLAAALKSNPQASQTYKDFSYTNQKEYLEWITGAKRPETRQKRLTTAIEWMSEGKPRNWKYTRKK